MLITLTGMPGSGKTTVGRIVADALGCPFMDLERILAEREPLYEAAAHVTLDTDGASPETLADEIIISVL